MNGKMIGLAIALLLAVPVGWILSNRPTSAQVEQISYGQRWEYCALSKAAYAGSNRGGLFWISYFRDSGVQVVEIEDPALEKNGPAKAIAKLGAEGWEMVGQGPLEIRQATLAALYFKRPKP